GHIHKQEIVSRDPFVVFPGCIQGRHIKESGPKGCILVTVEEEAVKEIEKIPLDVLRWVHTRIDLTDIEERRDILEIIRQTIEQEQISAEERPLAMRLKLIGATKLSDQLAAFPENFEQQIKALGAETAGDQLWIERIENKTRGKYDLESALAHDNAMGKLLKSILSIPDDIDRIEGLADKLAELRQKAPQTFKPDSILDLNNGQTIKRITGEAKKMLIGRLLSTGGNDEN
ncbi:MAG: DNA repair exonuclease, partial [Desulfobacterales bacterium]|nr:DNA repair exonuclease [Desulfobacterales bacterium]